MVCHVLCHVSWYFQIVKKIQYFKSNGFCGWGQLSEVRSSRAEPTAPGPARARPSGWYFQSHRPKPHQVWEIPVPRDVGPVRPASFQSHWSSAQPGPWDSQDIFVVSSCCVSSSSRFRGSNVLASPGPAASFGSRSLSTIGIRSRVCQMPLTRHTSSYVKMSRILMGFF